MNKQKSIIKENEKKGQEIYCKDEKLKFIGFPVNREKTSQIDLVNGKISFEGSFDGTVYHTINDFNGSKFIVFTKAAQEVAAIPNFVDPSFAILPIREPGLFDGLLMIRAVVDIPEPENRTIEFYFE